MTSLLNVGQSVVPGTSCFKQQAVPHDVAFPNGTAISGIAQQGEQDLSHGIECCYSKARL